MKNFIAVITLLIFSASSTIAQYCTSKADSPIYEWVDYVGLAFEEHDSPSSSYGYQSFLLNFTIDMTKGECYNLSLVPGYSGSSYNEHWGVWIDFNQDNDFDDPGEEVFRTSAGVAGPISANVDIPLNAQTGYSRMRVVMSYHSNQLNHCGTYTYGETEDYTVNIQSHNFICNSQGNNTSYEWIDGVGVNNETNVYEANNGYERTYCSGFEIVWDNPCYFYLYPGFSGSAYNEYWRVWIDFNDNDSFDDAGEQIINMSASEDVLAIHIFDGTPPVPIDRYFKMRVAMKYGSPPASCGNFTYGSVHDYAVFIRDPNTQTIAGNEDQFQMKSQDPRSATGDLRSELTLNVFPNPASDWIELKGTAPEEASLEVKLINSQGQIFRQFTDGEGINERIDIHDLPAGTYYMQVWSGSDSQVIPFVVLD